MSNDNYVHLVTKLVVCNTSRWCSLPYKGHKKGCGNLGEKWCCPPKIGGVGDHFELDSLMLLINSSYDLIKRVEELRLKHPDWSERKLRCVRYWQETSRAQMRKRAKEAMKLLNLDQYTECPEGMGVNVYATGRLAQPPLLLERIKDLKVCRHTALIGIAKKVRS